MKGAETVRGYWLRRAHWAALGLERAWNAAAERISRYGVSTGPAERAGTEALAVRNSPHDGTQFFRADRGTSVHRIYR